MMRPNSCLFLVVLATALVGWAGVASGWRTDKDDRAIRKVLRSMAKASKPLRLPPSPNNTRTPVTVGLNFDLLAVSDVNIKGGYVDLEWQLDLMWVDPRLTFDLPKSSARLGTVRVNPKTIWIPDIEAYREMSPGLQIETCKPAVVSRSGDVFFSTRARLRSTCDVIGQLSSGDVLNCTVKLGSWTYNGEEVQFSMTSVGLSGLENYQPAGLWMVTSSKAWLGESRYSCCPEPFPFVKLNYSMKKRSLPHWLND